MREFALALLLALPLAGCTDIYYLGDEGFFAFAITEDTPPFAETDDAALFIVEQRIELPIREPSGEQMAALVARGQELGLTFPRAPWVERHHYRIQVDYIVKNLDDAPHRVTVTVNGINEFHEYSPGVVLDDDEIIAEFSGWERLMELGPLAERSGTVRAEELEEVAADLSAVVQPGVTNPNTFVHPDSQSDRDPRAIPFLPPVIPGLVGLKVGIRTEEQANVVCEVTVRVRDERNRIVAQSRAWQMPAPEVFEPSSVTGALP